MTSEQNVTGASVETKRCVLRVPHLAHRWHTRAYGASGGREWHCPGRVVCVMCHRERWADLMQLWDDQWQCLAMTVCVKLALKTSGATGNVTHALGRKKRGLD